jgi:hypothetical protein
VWACAGRPSHGAWFAPDADMLSDLIDLAVSRHLAFAWAKE